MSRYRQNRINEEMTKEISLILQKVKDPRVSSSFVTVTDSAVTADLKYAKIYYSVIGDEKTKDDVASGLKSATGFIRREIARNLNLRICPEISFVFDPSAERSEHIFELLKSIETETARENDDEQH